MMFLLRLITCSCALCFICALLLNFSNVWINLSDSLAHGVYTVTTQKSDLKKGDLILTCIPELYSNFALERSYLMAGKCYDKVAPVGKYIVATTGDLVQSTSDGIYVNHILIKNSKALNEDKNGNPMFIYKINRKLTENELFVINEKENSFDSRYFGIINKRQVIGKLQVLKTF